MSPFTSLDTSSQAALTTRASMYGTWTTHPPFKSYKATTTSSKSSSLQMRMQGKSYQRILKFQRRGSRFAIHCIWRVGREIRRFAFGSAGVGTCWSGSWGTITGYEGCSFIRAETICIRLAMISQYEYGSSRLDDVKSVLPTRTRIL
jgi:hypothetical protein